MHALNVFLFRLIGISLFVNMNLYFPNADHPALILFCTSFSVLTFISIYIYIYIYDRDIYNSSTFSISMFSTIIFLFVLKFVMYLDFPL